MSIYPGGYTPSVGMSIYPAGYMPSVGMSIYLGGHTPSVEASQITTDFYDETDTAPVSITEFGEITVVDRLAGMVEMLITRWDKKSTVPIESKILLTLDEAQALTGLSRAYLRDVINQGNLNAKQIGKSWQVKRSDLDDFVEDLF